MNAETVVFRRWHNGSVIALFPHTAADVNGLYCASYEQIGQHGGADYEGVVARTRPALPHEYADIKRELEGAPYHYVLSVKSRARFRPLTANTHTGEQT